MAEQLRDLHLVEAVCLPFVNAADLYTALRLRGLVRRCGAGLVHAHCARDYIPAAFAATGNAALVFTRHLLYPLGRSPIHRWACGKVNAVIAVSEAVEKSLKEVGIIAPEKIVTIPNGVDVDAFSKVDGEKRTAFKKELGIPPEGRATGIVGQISPHKGHEDFVDAAAVVARRFPDVVFVIAGEDRSARRTFERRLREKIAALGIESRVVFTGFVQDVPKLLGVLDLLVVPSWEEPFGLVVAEAMAAGLPVVATGRGGPAEMLKSGETGILVEPRDPAGIAKAMEAVLENADLAERLSANARKVAVERYSLKRQLDETADLMRSLLRSDRDAAWGGC